jgi:hypothetical protein
MESGYRQEQLGGGRVRFTVTPAPAPRSRATPLALALLVLLLLGATGIGAGAMAWSLRLVVAAAAALVAYREAARWSAARVDKHRSPGGVFVVSPTSIEPATGAVLGRHDLRRLIVRNGVSTRIEPTEVRIGSVLPAAPPNAPEHAAPRTGACVISFMLCAEGGGSLTTLGGGMTEATALGLLREVSRILSPSHAAHEMRSEARDDRL